MTPDQQRHAITAALADLHLVLRYVWPLTHRWHRYDASWTSVLASLERRQFPPLRPLVHLAELACRDIYFSGQYGRLRRNEQRVLFAAARIIAAAHAVTRRIQ